MPRKVTGMDIQQHVIDSVIAGSQKTTFWSAVLSFVAGLSLNDWGVIVGIFGVIVGVAVNVVFKVLHYRLEKQKAGL